MKKIFFRKVELWVLILTLIISLLAWGGVISKYYRHKDSEKLSHNSFLSVAGFLAELPRNINEVRKIMTGKKGGKSDLVTIEQRFENQSGFQFNYLPNNNSSHGYVLINRYDGDHEYSISDLVDLDAQETVYSWRFSDIGKVWEQSSLTSNLIDFKTDSPANRFQNTHAIVTETGELITHGVDTPIIKADICSNLSIIQEDAIYHHSIERDHFGNLWVPNRIEPKSVKIGSSKFQDDGITNITLDGHILYEKSIIKILDDNGLGYLIYGSGNTDDDPIHLNDIQPVLKDGPYWKQGDLFLSLRNKSMVILYRPSTNKIIWHKQGPWLHQHDVNILNNHQISIFNNNTVLSEKSDMMVNKNNNLYIYDFTTDEITSPFYKGFKELDIRTKYAGVGKKISGDHLFVEETDFGRLVQLDTKGKTSWQYINRANDNNIYLLSWSRPISRKLGDQIRIAVTNRGCS